MGRLLTGPHLPSLETEAMGWAAEHIDGGIDEVLYLTRGPERIPAIEDRWRDHGDPLEMDVVTLDSFVHGCHEQAFHETEHSHIRSGVRDRLVEIAVERLSGTDNPLATEGLPSRGLSDSADELLTLMEFADLLSPSAIETRLREEELDRQARIISTLGSAFGEVREEHTELRGGVPLSIRGERYSRLVNDGPDLGDLRPAPSVVILGGFTLLSPLERRVIADVVDTWPTTAILPSMTGPGGPDGGADAAVDRIHDAYVEMGLDPSHRFSNGRSQRTPMEELAAQLYRRRSSDEGAEREIPGLERYQAPTRPMEVRSVARSIQEDIDDGVAAPDIGVVVAGGEAYRSLVSSTFRQYEIPFTSGLDEPVLETAVGGAIVDAIRLTEPTPRIGRLASLLANPLVEPWDDIDASDVLAPLRDIGGRLDTDTVDRAVSEMDGQEARLTTLLDTLATLRDRPLADLETTIEELLLRLGIDDELARLPLGGRRERIERTALGQVTTTAAEVAMTAQLLPTGTSARPFDRLERALQGAVVDTSPDRDSGRIVVTDLSGVGIETFERVYLVGCSAGDFPSEPDRLAFTRPINEADEDFAQADTRKRARYHALVLMTAAERTTITMAERDIDGRPLVESDLLAELERTADLGPETPDLPPGTGEDVQRSISTAAGSPEERHELVDRATDAGSFDERMTERAHAGIECAAARSTPGLSPYDGQLSSETRRALLGGVDGSHAPTALETYASCGFKYYMMELLGLEDPDEITLEGTPIERGSFVHDVLERFYLDIQADIGEPVTATVDTSPTWQARLLDIALDELGPELSEDPTPFQEGWLLGVFAGLGDADSNPYHGRQIDGVQEQGVLYRFLEEEAAMDALSVNPTWFEARFGPERWFDGTVLQEEPVAVQTPHGEVPITGTVDRIDTVATDDGIQLVVRDYKTGYTPSEAATLDGARLQLPMYALMAEAVLGAESSDVVETVGGSYYQVKPPAWVSHNSGQIGSQELTAHARSDGGEPLVAWRYPRFDEHGEFRTFIEEGFPERLGQIAAALEEGAYHPTILDPSDAGCRYCGFSHVCDVRSHQRHETMAEIESEDHTAYIPPLARGESYTPETPEAGD